MIREQPQLKSTRVILIGVSRFANDRDTAIATGADAYLVKPIVPGELSTALDQCEDQRVTTSRAPTGRDWTNADPLLGRARIYPDAGLGHSAMFGGNTSCVEVRVGEQVIVLDAGSGIRALGQSLMREFRDKPLNLTMLVTHTHWDHIQGFPFFIPAYNPKVEVRIVGYEGAVHGLRGALFEQMQSAFFPGRTQSNGEPRHLRGIERLEC